MSIFSQFSFPSACSCQKSPVRKLAHAGPGWRANTAQKKIENRRKSQTPSRKIQTNQSSPHRLGAQQPSARVFWLRLRVRWPRGRLHKTRPPRAKGGCWWKNFLALALPLGRFHLWNFPGVFFYLLIFPFSVFRTVWCLARARSPLLLASQTKQFPGFSFTILFVF